MNDVIELFIPVPKPTTKSERIQIVLLGLLFSYASVLLALLVLVLYDWFYAIAFGLVGYIIQSIVLSKISHEFVPFRQWEHRYSSHELAAWVVLRYKERDESGL